MWETQEFPPFGVTVFDKGVTYFRQVGASFPFKRNALRNEELLYPSSLILLVFCVFIEKFISFGVTSEIGCSDYANEWSIKKKIKLDILSYNYELRNALSEVKAMQNLTIRGSVVFFFQHLYEVGGIFQHLANCGTSAKRVNSHGCRILIVAVEMYLKILDR